MTRWANFEGDLVLGSRRTVAGAKIRQSNVVARYGETSSSFSCLKPGRRQAQVLLAERLRQWIATDPMLSEHHITGSSA